MGLKVAVQMNHINSINPKADSTFALMLEAERRGHLLMHYTPDRLTLVNDKSSSASALYTTIEVVKVFDRSEKYFSLDKQERINLNDCDVLLMRQNPPFDMSYITSTHMLEQLTRPLVVNNPFHVRNSLEKLFTMERLADLMPSTIITRNLDEIRHFCKEHKEVVMKPLHYSGGCGIFRIKSDDFNFNSIVETFMNAGPDPWVTQQFCPEVIKGDKRILLVDGQFAGVIQRVPAAGDFRANLVLGGRAEITTLSDREHEICKRIEPLLRDMELLFVGIDTIGDHLIEMNVTSPTGIRSLEDLGGPNIASLIWDVIERKIIAKQTQFASL